MVRHTYTHFLQTCVQVANTLGMAVEASHVLQFHGDLHKGIEKARIAVFPQSHRLADWAHVTGATSQGPNGLHGFLHQSFPANTGLTRFALQWCRISKCMTRLLFHEVWSNIFSFFEAKGHAVVVSKLQKQYFHRVAAPDGS